MSRIVGDHVIGMISERADAICDQKTEPPVTKSQSAHRIRGRCLQDHSRKREQSGIRISSHQMSNFRMR